MTLTEHDEQMALQEIRSMAAMLPIDYVGKISLDLNFFRGILGTIDVGSRKTLKMNRGEIARR